jgi:hypothetical protein
MAMGGLLKWALLLGWRDVGEPPMLHWAA